MRKPLPTADEPRRLALLDSLGLIYSPAEERFDRITRLARRVFGVPIAIVSLVSCERQWFKSVQGLAVTETPRELSFCSHAIHSDAPLVIADASQHPFFADNPLVNDAPHIRFYAGHPLTYDEVRLGTLCLIDRQPRHLKPDDLDALRSLACWVENELRLTAFSQTQVELLRELEEARRQALFDPVTQSWNRRGAQQLLQREIMRAEQDGKPVALLFIDMDNFKQINDRYGHLAGDAALREVAQRIRAAARPVDMVARYGGDEFMVLLGGCGAAAAVVIAERIMARILAAPVQVGEQSVEVALSIGVAVAPPFDSDALLQQADRALYVAKSAGRGCIRVERA